MQNKPIRVLLADDHKLVRAGIRQFLDSSKRIQVIGEAQNGAEAIQMVAGHSPDVLVLDIQMPVLNGIETTKKLRISGNKVGILILTAYDDPPYVQALLQAGANGYVLKTAEPEEIIAAVLDVFQGKTVVDQLIYQSSNIRGDAYDMEINPQKGVLSDREIQVLAAAAGGLTNKAIAAHLSISSRTVQNHLANIFTKLNSSSRTEAVLKAVKLGYIAINDDQVSILIDGSNNVTPN